ncbi:MAG: sulfatase-like hydrolase/transferase [Dehalococcoidia bacterium]
MPKPSNILLFLSDNHARSMTGVYGHPLAATPNIDRIARSGTVFRNAYSASPLCCPARASLATGLFPHQTGYWDNTFVYDGRVPSWHHLLRDQGHEVTSIGKLHYRSSKDDNGFSEEIIPMHMVEGGGALFGLMRATDEGERRRAAARKSYEACAEGEADYVVYDREITRHARHWIREHALHGSKPWVLLVSYSSPHPPFVVPKKYRDLYSAETVPLPVQFRESERPRHPSISHIRTLHSYDDLGTEGFVKEVVASYLAMITFMDEQIGEVLSEIETTGLLPSTRVIYTSDHGEAAGAHGLFGKSVLYEHSIGVPLVMCGPEIRAGTTISQLTSHVDLFPTLVESAGAQPDTDSPRLGASLWPAIEGREDASRCAFAEFHGHGSKSASYMLRQNDMKLVYHVGERAQLFDLERDPQEMADLNEERSDERGASLENRLREILDPEAVDGQAKSDQRRRLAELGGVEAVLRRGTFGFNPIPGRAAKLDGFQP